MNLVVQAFRFAAEPFFFSNASDKNSPALFARVNHYFVITCCLLFLGVALNMDWLRYFVSSSYWAGLNIVPILLLGYLFLGIYYNFSVWFKLTDKTYFGTLITAGGAILTIVLNYTLIPLAGFTGSSWATLIVYLVMAVACYWSGRRYYPIPYRVTSELGYILLCVALVVTVPLVEIINPWIASAFHETAILFFLLVFYLAERRSIRSGFA
jgi:O-antigen/teichoic acid export membrane protein